MRKSLSLGLRWSCLLVITSCAAHLVGQALHRTDWYKDRLYQRLLQGEPEEQLDAAVALAYLRAEDHLLQALRVQNPPARQLAQRALEHIWFTAAGDKAYELTQAAYLAADRGETEEALKILNRLIELHPQFAEAWNRRASVYWQMGQFRKSISDCERTLALNPNHYGAWQGVGICQLELGKTVEACQSLRQALRINPYDEPTRRSLRRCEELLRIFPHPGEVTRGDLII